MKINLKNSRMICFLIAFFPVYALKHMLKSSLELHPIGNSILAVIAFAGVYFVLRAAIRYMDKRLAVTSGILGFFFSGFMICGTSLLMFGTTQLNQPIVWFRILCGTPLFAALVALTLVYLSKWNQITQLQRLKVDLSVKKVFFLCWLLIFLAWIPGLIACYPGIYVYDCAYQMGYYASGVISLHHPLIHTYLAGFFVQTLGGGLFGSLEVGLLCYSLFQMLCLSAVFACICVYLKKRNVSVVIRGFVLALFMFLPVHALLSFTATKDVLFTALFALLVWMFLQIAEDEKALSRTRFCIALVAVSFAFIIFRNQGIYVFILGMIVAFVFLRKHWKRLLAVFLSVLVLYGVYSGPITALLGGQKANSLQEMMSVPCMQLSRAMLYCADDLTPQEKQMIAEYIPGYEAYLNSPGISDSMKNSFDSGRFSENPFEFIKLWAGVGLKCPLTYIDAFARLTIGLWYPDMNYRDYGAYHPYWDYDSAKQDANGSFIIVDRYTPEAFQGLADFYSELTYENPYQNIPVVSMLFSSGLTVWLCLLYFAWCLYGKHYRHLPICAFILGLWLTLLLGPVVVYRYVYPLVVVIPLLAGSALTTKTYPEKKENKNG